MNFNEEKTSNKPIAKRLRTNGLVWTCPKCEELVLPSDNTCPKCGHLINWELFFNNRKQRRVSISSLPLISEEQEEKLRKREELSLAELRNGLEEAIEEERTLRIARDSHKRSVRSLIAAIITLIISIIILVISIILG